MQCFFLFVSLVVGFCSRASMLFFEFWGVIFSCRVGFMLGWFFCSSLSCRVCLIFLFVLLCWWVFGIAVCFVAGLGGKGCLF